MNVLELTVETEPKDAGIWRLYPIGDLHVDSKMTDLDRLKKYIALVAADPHGMYVIVGDFVDGTTPSHHFFEPDVIVPDIMQNMSQYVAATMLMLERMLEPLKDTPGVVIQGNHDVRKGGTLWSGIAWEMARRLGAEYGGDECLVRIKASTPQKSRGNYVWVLHAFHGDGGGMYPGGKVNRFQNTVGHLTDADILVRGHVHDSDTRIVPLYSCTRKGGARMVEKRRAYVTAPAFMRNRVEGVNSYASRKGYPPSDDGLIYLEVANPSINKSKRDGTSMRRIEAPF
jgi:hypothetical protein